MPILGKLKPLFDVVPTTSPSARLSAKDNAAGAVGRMIVKNTGALPLDQVLPVFIGALPLRNDLLENRPVFRAIFHLFQTNGAALVPYIDALLQVFAHVLDPSVDEQVTDETRQELIRLVQAINQEKPDAVRAAGLSAFA